jgi:hypothetical protein
MPRYSSESDREGKSGSENELEISSRIMNTVQQQIADYRLALEKVRGLRKECELDTKLNERIRSDPEAMAHVLVQRGIAPHLAISMVAEDFQYPGFGAGLAVWTWDCCCSDCCVTGCIGTSFARVERDPVQLDALFGSKVKR